MLLFIVKKNTEYLEKLQSTVSYSHRTTPSLMYIQRKMKRGSTKKKYQLFGIWLESSYRIAFSSIVDLNYLSEKVWKSSKTKHSLAPSLPFC